MCDYCDCRDLAPIKELSDEHERISRLAAELRHRLDSGESAPAALAALQAALDPHLAKEEAGLFAQLARRSGFEWYLKQLMGDHTRARDGLLAPSAAGAEERAGLLACLDELAAHIETEEHDLFPASRLILDDLAWSEVMVAHQRQENNEHPAPAAADAARAR